MSLAVVLVPGLASGIAWSAVAVLATMAAALVVGRIRDRYRDIDVFWPLGFVAVAVVGYLSTSGEQGGDVVQRSLLLLVVALWGVRLAFHLAMRSRGEGEDPRYERMMRGRSGVGALLRSLWLIYGLQGLLMLVISLPISVGMHAGSPIAALQVLGAVVWLVGVGFESVGDAQLEAFRRDPEMKGKVLDSGLWAWTRHPNYFGDATAWWGIYLVASAGLWGFATVLSPLLMTLLLTRVSGKPMLEAQLARSRPGYAEYVARTPGFLPRPPRRPSA